LSLSKISALDEEDELLSPYPSYWFFIFLTTLLVEDDLDIIGLFDARNVSCRMRLESLVLLGRPREDDDGAVGATFEVLVSS
jgi:hypothetical protein